MTTLGPLQVLNSTAFSQCTMSVLHNLSSSAQVLHPDYVVGSPSSYPSTYSSYGFIARDVERLGHEPFPLYTCQS